MHLSEADRVPNLIVAHQGMGSQRFGDRTSQSSRADDTAHPLIWTPENVHMSLAEVRSFPSLEQDDFGELSQMRIEPEDFEFFRHLFVGEQYSYCTRLLNEASWSFRNERLLSNRLILSHLRGDRWVATGARWDRSLRKFRTHLFVIDLDAKGQGFDLYGRYDAVCKALGAPSLVFRSSASGGLHLYYFLDQDVDLFRIRNPQGDRGAVVRLLQAHGLYECSGRLEIYPRGKFKRRGVQSRLRVPFGSGSRLLRPDDLTPLLPGTSRCGELKAARRLFEDDKVNLVPFDELWAAASKVPWPVRGKSRSSVTRAPEEDIQRRDEYVNRLHVQGLSEPGEFNRAVSALAFSCRWDAVSEDRAIHWIQTWAGQMHNGQSRTCLNPSRAFREIADVVSRIYARHVPSAWGRRPSLSLFEARSVFAATTLDQSVMDPETGEVLKRLKLQRFIFELLRSAKQFVLARGEREAIQLATEQPLALRDGDSWSTELAWRCHSFWPDSNLNRFIVECPYVHRVSLPLISENTIGAYWRAALATGLLTQVRAPQWPKPVCAAFSVELDFGAKSSPRLVFDSVEQAAQVIVPPDQTKALYSRNARTRILNWESGAEVPHEPTNFECFVRARLMRADKASARVA